MIFILFVLFLPKVRLLKQQWPERLKLNLCMCSYCCNVLLYIFCIFAILHLLFMHDSCILML